jgi:hypothetical protein
MRKGEVGARQHRSRTMVRAIVERLAQIQGRNGIELFDATCLEVSL